MAVRNRLSAWAARWLVASLAVTASACSWSSTTDRGGPMSAFHPCAETSMWASAPLPEQRRGALEVGCATLTVPVDHADPGRGSLDTAVVRVRATSQHDRIGSLVLVIATEADPATPHSGGVALARVLGPNAKLLTVSGGGHTAFGRSPCVAEHVTVYLVELRVPGGQAC